MRHKPDNKWGLKTIIICMAFIVASICVYGSQLLEGEMKAETASTRFNLYDKVNITSDTYTVIDNSNNQIKLLCDSNWCTTGTTYTYSDTDKYLNGSSTSSYGYYYNSHGYEGRSVLTGKFSIPSTADLQNVTTGDTLDSRIATSSSGFWLSDSGGTNRQKYIDQNNSFLGENTVNTTPQISIVNNNKTCTYLTGKETGILPVQQESIHSNSKDIITGSSGLSIGVLLNATTPVGGWGGDSNVGIIKYSDEYCTTKLATGAYGVANSTAAIPTTWSSSDGFSKTTSNGAIPRSMFLSEIGLMDFFKLSGGGQKITKTYYAGNCININGYGYSDVKSVKMQITGSVTYTIKGTPLLTKITEKCTSTNPAGKTGRRPILTLSNDDIITINNNKRDYTPSGRINQSLPTSDAESNTEKKVITLRNNNLKVSLKTGATGVNGDTYTVLKPSDGIVSLPLAFTGNRDDGSTVVVSAKANIGGKDKYGILATIGKATTQNVELNLNDFSDNLTSLNEVKLTLFQESSGIKDSSYQGEEKEITVLLETPKEQTITFDENMPTTATYGDKIELSARLTSPLNEAANTNLLFSIKSGNAVVSSQSYNDDATGKAVALITPTSGEGKIVVAINKAGGTNISAAEEQTIEIILSKKELTISPKKLNKIFQLNDPMPTITSEYTGLVKGDEQYVSSILPILSPLGDTTASRPDSGGVVAYTGRWKLVYLEGIIDGLTDLNARYDVTLLDYNDDSSHVFETAITDVPEGWVVIEPDANAKGWNKEDVIIKPSEEAVNAGYDRIEIMNGETVSEFGASITYSKDTTGITPVVRLCKGEVCTNTQNAPRTIKIDKIKPATSISVANENGWSSSQKEVIITAVDVTSGIDLADVKILYNGTTSFTPVQDGNDYKFQATKNGSYMITVSDRAGNEASITKEITGIDNSVPTLTATLQAKPEIPTYQDVDITWSAGDSGIKTFKVYHKQNDGTYTLLESFVPEQNTFVYKAEMNGTYKFEIINQANQNAIQEIEITGLTPPYPDTLIEAVYEDDPTQAYASDTWTNHNVVLSLHNANDELNIDGVTFSWEMSDDGGNSWTSMNNETTFTVSHDTYKVQTYLFKVTAAKDADTFVEQSPASFTVKIDKRKPNTPTIKDNANYTQSNWYQDDVTLESSFIAKGSGIGEVQYVCVNTKENCENDDTLWKTVTDGTYLISGNGEYEVYFKVIDEAGNSSDLSSPAYVNINDAQPEIKIILNDDPINSFLNQITLGYFFKDTVKVDVEVNFNPNNGSNNTTGKTYIVIDETGSGMPEVNDPIWGSDRSSTTIDPDKKVMIYVKAVSDAGAITRESSIYDVYVDHTKPNINVLDTTGVWTNEASLNVEITDEVSGIDRTTLQYIVDQKDTYAFTLVNDQANINGLKDGEYNIEIQAQDHSGNAESVTVPVKIDTAKPEIGEPIGQLGSSSKRTVTFNANDRLSGIDQIIVSGQLGGTPPNITDHHDGTYSFEVTQNDTYTINVIDHAGNSATRNYVESSLDNTAPIISHIVIEKENDWTINKKVNFHVEDTESTGQNIKVVVTYIEDGEQKQAAVSGPINTKEFSFTASINGTYTISATDEAGNRTTETVEVANIDPDGFKIVHVSDIQTWVKDEMMVSFEVRTSTSSMSSGYPKVTKDGVPYPVTQNNGKYEFTADVNGTYIIVAENTIGDHVEEILDIQKIDYLPPVITDVSENHTASEYREPQDITFRVYDYNSDNQSDSGSGLKTGYPIVYYLKDGNRVNVAVTQDEQDLELYHFIADQNTTYYVEAMDQVEHDLVSVEIQVDHIQLPDQMIDYIVSAESDGKLISSGTWTKEDITFTIQGGLEEATLESYQVAITNGSKPAEKDWQDINMQSERQHIVSDDTNRKSYWFRAKPVLDQSHISKPFIVNLDKKKPENVTIIKTKENTNAMARFMNAVTFGSWMKEAMSITFDATDNFTPKADLQYYYATVKEGTPAGVPLKWQKYTGSLSFEDVDLTIHVKAIDLAGNESDIVLDTLQIDTQAPVISGVQDQKEYKQYYLPRFVIVSDEANGSGLKQATYKKNGTEAGTFTDGVIKQIKGEGTYEIYAIDMAGNDITITFKIVKLPDIETEIDGSDESKDIIDQIIKELEEVKDQIDDKEKTDYEQWIKDAEEKWDSLRRKVIEDEKTTSKVEGQGDTTFDPKTELIVEEISKEEIPSLPRNAIKIYDVYLKKGNAAIQPNGRVKVYLPYTEKEPPIVYEINEDGTITELDVQYENGYVTFYTDKLKRYAISNTAQEELKKDVCVVGPDSKLDSNDDVCGEGNDSGVPPVKEEDGSVTVPEGGKVIFPDKIVDAPDGATINPDGTVDFPDGTHFDPDGNETKNPDSKPAPTPDDPKDPDAKPTPNDPNVCQLKDGDTLNEDSDGDGLPDLNLDIDQDCVADLNIDIDKDGIPDLNIDTNGDGKPDINIDHNEDGYPELNIKKLAKWTPNKDCDFNGFKYDTMGDLEPDLNIDSDGDGKPDRNVDTDGDGIPDVNVDEDWFSKRGMSDPRAKNSNVQGTYTQNVGGASTSDSSKWIIWWIILGLTLTSMGYTMYKNRRKQR